MLNPSQIRKYRGQCRRKQRLDARRAGIVGRIDQINCILDDPPDGLDPGPYEQELEVLTVELTEVDAELDDLWNNHFPKMSPEGFLSAPNDFTHLSYR